MAKKRSARVGPAKGRGSDAGAKPDAKIKPADAKPEGQSRGRAWLEAIKAADPELSGKAAQYADAALKCLDVGDMDNAVHDAMWAAWNVAHDAGKWGHWQMQSTLMPLAGREMTRRDALAASKADKDADFRRRLDDAIERLAALLNSKSKLSYTAKVRKAAQDAGISWRALWKHLPASLKRE